MSQLAGFLNLDEDDLGRVLIPLSSVIVAPKSGKIQILHLSFREFMTSNGSKLCQMRRDLLCGTEDQNQEIASRVLWTMQNRLKFNICDIPTSHLKNAAIPDLQKRIDVNIPEYLRYCCCFWAEHVTAVSHDAKNEDEVKSFLEAKCLFWLEVLSLMGIIPRASSMLSKLMIWSKVLYSINITT
jgi:hypothetical protein